MKNSVIAFLLVATIAMANISFAQEGKGIKFENDSLAKILAKAKSEGKDIFKEGNIIPSEIIQYLQKAVSFSRLSEGSVSRDIIDSVSVKSPVFQYLVANREKFYTLYTTDSVGTIIRDIYGMALDRCFMDTDTMPCNNLRAELMKLDLLSIDPLIIGADLLFYKTTQNWQQYAKTVVLHLERYQDDKYQLLNNYYAYSFYEHVDDTVYLNKALNWSKRLIEINDNHSCINTYASLLYKLGRKAEAQVMEEKAIELVRKEGGDPSKYEEFLTKMGTQ